MKDPRRRPAHDGLPPTASIRNSVVHEPTAAPWPGERAETGPIRTIASPHTHRAIGGIRPTAPRARPWGAPALALLGVLCGPAGAGGAAVADRAKSVDPATLGGSEYCGQCHTDIFHQWNPSTHHFSSFNNPVYRKVVLATIARKGPGTYAFCAGCHDPLLRSGGLTDAPDTDSWEANAGITCLSCHRITAIGEGNGDYRIEEPVLHPFALSNRPFLAKVHKTMIEVTPWLHRQVLSKSFYETSDYCAACHSLRVPAAINGMAPMALSDEIGQLHGSRRNRPQNGAPGRCIECHMPEVPSTDPAAKDGLIRSHRFAGSNTALATFNRDLDHRQAVESFLSADRVRLRVAGLRTAPDRPFQGPETAAPVAAGDLVEIALEVRNSGAGHQFPNGTVDSNEAWLSVVATDGDHRTFAALGQLDARGLVPVDAVRFGTRFADAAGNPTDRRTTTTDAVSIADDTAIPIGGSRTVYYRLAIPADARPPFAVEFVLNWRKYSPAFIDWVFDGRATPALPVTAMASLRLALPAPAGATGATGASATAASVAPDRTPGSNRHHGAAP